jgi:ribosomal protein S10
MSFVTRLTLQSGDRATLDRVVADLKATVERKGAAFNGPHSLPTAQLSVPLYRATDGDGTVGTWTYTVYTRELELVGREDLARSIVERSFPDSVHVELEVERT